VDDNEPTREHGSDAGAVTDADAVTEPTPVVPPQGPPAYAVHGDDHDPGATVEAPLSTPFEHGVVAGEASAPSRAGRGWLATVAVAALVGGLIGGGLVAVLDGDDASTAARTFVPDRRAGPPSVIAEPQAIHGILAEVRPAVVAIRTQASVFGRFGPVRGAGSGMIITPDGDVLTNAHVVAGDPAIKVTLEGEREARDADIVGTDPQNDVALLRIRNASDLPVVTLGSSSALSVGDDVVAIGNALALPGGPSVTKGIVSALDREIEGDSITLSGLIQTDAAINPGNSGGPLVNSQGDVVGINTAVIQTTGEALAQNIGFAIAIDTVKPLLDDLRAGRSLDRPEEIAFLGVETQTLTPDIADQFDFEIQRGAIVARVTAGSPAEQAGLRRGDVIVRIGDDEINSASDLVNAVRSHSPGDRVEIVWRRGDDDQRATVTLVSRAAALSQ